MYKNLLQPINHIPYELTTIRITCEKCRFQYPPNWLEKLPEPFVPVESIGGVWRPLGQHVECPACQHDNLFKIPQKVTDSTYLLYGDEAFRIVDNKKLIITYSLVGINRRFLNILEEKVKDLKKQIFPDLKPEEWSLHMKDMWSSDSRKKSIFKDLSHKNIIEIVEKFFQIIREINNGLIVYNISAIGNLNSGLTKKILNERKVELYSILILRIIDELTNNKIVPKFIFDADKVVKEEYAIHEWASRSFLGTQHSLLYAYLSGAKEIEEPKFVKPASSTGLEVADFVSYVIARYCYRRLTKSPIDLDLKKLGNIYYLGFENGRDFLYTYQDDYPWDMFYGAID